MAKGSMAIFGHERRFDIPTMELPQDGWAMACAIERACAFTYFYDVHKFHRRLVPLIDGFHIAYTTANQRWPLVVTTSLICQMSEGEEKLSVKERKAIVRRDRKVMLWQIFRLIRMYILRGRAHKHYFTKGIWPSMCKHGEAR